MATGAEPCNDYTGCNRGNCTCGSDTETPKRHPRSERFHEELTELGSLHDAKQQDYGTSGDPFHNITASEEFGIPAWQGAILRGNDKMSRIKTFIQKGSLKNESLEDSLRDLAVYSIISLVLFKEDNA